MKVDNSHKAPKMMPMWKVKNLLYEEDDIRWAIWWIK